MLTAFFILSPLVCLALYGFAKRVHPLTGRISPDFGSRGLAVIPVKDGRYRAIRKTPDGPYL